MATAIDGTPINARPGHQGFCAIPLAQRFAAHTRREGDCIVWTGKRGRAGHGRIRYEGRDLAAHRVNYERLRGPIPVGLVLDHLCRNPPCVNPDHLEPVTCRENTMRSDALSALNARKTHCVSGHELSGINLKRRLRAGRWERVCRTCERASQAKYRAKRRELKKLEV